MHRLSFTDHRRKLNENRYVYAVVSRRSRGLSIGINLNPDKACNFACPYCQVDRQIEGGARRIDLGALSQELDHLLGLIQKGGLWEVPPFNTAKPAFRRVSDIAFAGDGEPTACPQFAEAVRVVAAERERYEMTEVDLNLLTNATLFHRRAVRDGLDSLWQAGGVVWAKLDAGTEEWFRRVDGTSFPFSRVLENIGWASGQRPLVLQSMFHRFGEEAPSAAEIEAWCGRISDILNSGGEISLVQVYTTARTPAQPDVLPLEKQALEEIATLARAVVEGHQSSTSVQVY